MAVRPLGGRSVRTDRRSRPGHAAVGPGLSSHAPRREHARRVQPVPLPGSRLRAQPAAPRPLSIPRQRDELLPPGRQRRHRAPGLRPLRHGPGGAALVPSRATGPDRGAHRGVAAGLFAHHALLQPIRPQRHPHGGVGPGYGRCHVALPGRRPAEGPLPAIGTPGPGLHHQGDYFHNACHLWRVSPAGGEALAAAAVARGRPGPPGEPVPGPVHPQPCPLGRPWPVWPRGSLGWSW